MILGKRADLPIRYSKYYFITHAKNTLNKDKITKKMSNSNSVKKSSGHDSRKNTQAGLNPDFRIVTVDDNQKTLARHKITKSRSYKSNNTSFSPPREEEVVVFNGHGGVGDDIIVPTVKPKDPDPLGHTSEQRVEMVEQHVDDNTRSIRIELSACHTAEGGEKSAMFKTHKLAKEKFSGGMIKREIKTEGYVGEITENRTSFDGERNNIDLTEKAYQDASTTFYNMVKDAVDKSAAQNFFDEKAQPDDMVGTIETDKKSKEKYVQWSFPLKYGRITKID